MKDHRRSRSCDCWFIILFLDIFILRKAPDGHELLNLLADINDKWYIIGSGLDVPRSVLNGLIENPQNNTYKLDQVIQTWIDSSDQYLVTWETVLTAIEGPIIDNKKKASEIRQFLLETYQGKYNINALKDSLYGDRFVRN